MIRTTFSRSAAQCRWRIATRTWRKSDWTKSPSKWSSSSTRRAERYVMSAELDLFVRKFVFWFTPHAKKMSCHTCQAWKTTSKPLCRVTSFRLLSSSGAGKAASPGKTATNGMGEKAQRRIGTSRAMIRGNSCRSETKVSEEMDPQDAGNPLSEQCKKQPGCRQCNSQLISTQLIF